MATFVDKLEKRFGSWAIPNLTFWIMVCQIAVFGFGLFTTFPVETLSLFPAEVLKGQVWRLFTFVIDPPMRQVSVWIIFAWYIFYFFGSTLEKEWGEFRYNLFFLIGIVCTAIAGLVSLTLIPQEYWPMFQVTNVYLMTSVTLAFAILFPNFQIMLFFILPVKMKWMALFILGMWVLSAGTSPIAWLMVLAALGNIGFFFGKQLIAGQHARKRRGEYEKKRKEDAAEPFHKCVVCGKTDLDDPEAEFAYKDGEGYCNEHWDKM